MEVDNMELPELEQGLQEIQQTPASPDVAIATAEAPWLSMDNLMQGYGNWFGNDQGLGEMLLGQLRAHGVDTQAATEAMLRELLQGLVDDMNTLQQRLSGFTSAIAQQMQQTQAVADSVEAAINSQAPNPMAQQIVPPEMPMMNDIPPETGADMGPVPPAPEAQPAAQADVPPAPEAPVEQPDVPPAPEAPAEQPAPAPQPEGTVSDAKEKNIVKPVEKKRFTLSDAAMKTLKAKLSPKPKAPSKPAGTSMNMNILAGCQGGF